MHTFPYLRRSQMVRIPRGCVRHQLDSERIGSRYGGVGALPAGDVTRVFLSKTRQENVFKPGLRSAVWGGSRPVLGNPHFWDLDRSAPLPFHLRMNPYSTATRNVIRVSRLKPDFDPAGSDLLSENQVLADFRDFG
jgi:hypothetical protein